ncbi:translation initiation factor IF-1 [Neorickettsia helminthoeca str. Oregon]|uniref:Translation initiation factor IF-1 n=1 Tax=Neorickettsia helminthoeca str. Oregon TaxID=1286528 RepID=X5HKY7_9RICK|nr:translation initiation factor IF-1 [Neorickettsia helminthoeca]AHX11759.1 translation initiation factor IF-1 [Neorickettsia helminthoeca str. Oregon]
MPKEDEKRFIGEVIEVLRGPEFRVRLENGKEILAHSCGKMRRKKIKIILSDKVVVAMSLHYDTNRGIIVEREGFRRRRPEDSKEGPAKWKPQK